MTTLLRILNDADIAVLLGLIAVVTVVGSKMTDADPAARQWGCRLAGVGFVAYTILPGLAFHARDADDWLGIVFRAALAAVLTMGVAWVVLSILFFLSRRLENLAAAPARLVESAATRKREIELPPNAGDARAQLGTVRRESQAAGLATANPGRSETSPHECPRHVTLTYNLLAAKLEHRFTRRTLDGYRHLHGRRPSAR